MKPWHQVCVPHRDIREGKFDESVFAADLSDVVADRGPLEYRDAQTFFRKTFPTQGLINLLAAMAARLSGLGKGEGIIQIQTPFGGGKTHSLIALYHLFNAASELASEEILSQVKKLAGVDSIARAKVATFVGTAPDPLKGKTPWGAMAEQLGRFDLLQEHDQRRQAPGKDLLHQLLAGSPTLILMDEIAAYAVAAKDFEGQVMVFFQQLTETVKVLPQCALIVTLPSSVPYGKEGEVALKELQGIFGRVEALYMPVEGEEIYEILRRRLFEETPDPAESRRVADSYWAMYQHLGDDIPRVVRETGYRDKLRKAYPFHPDLIDILFERWSTFSTFQRTRGVLRLLAEVVADLFQRQYPAPLIQPAHLNLTKPGIRREFLKHIGNEFEGIIATDIADGNAKAQKIDREMGSEYARFAIASGLATAIFFASFSGSEKRGVGMQGLRLALLREGIPPAVVGDALHRIAEELWFLHVEGGVYSFSNQPNLNRVRVEKEEQVDDEKIAAEIRSRLEKIIGTELQVRLWPQTSQDVPDNKELKLAVFSSAYTKQNPTTEPFVDELLRKYGTTFRTYQNTFLALVPDAGEYNAMRLQVKGLLAERAIKNDKTLLHQLSEENKRAVDNKIKDLESGIPFRLLSTYRHLAKAGDKGLMWLDLGIPTVGDKGSLAKRVQKYLISEELLLEKISPQNLLKKAVRDDETEKALADIADAFLKYPQLPMLENRAVVDTSVAQGVKDGNFGLKVGEQVFFKEPLPLLVIGQEAILLRREIAEQLKSGTEHGAPTPDTETTETKPPTTGEKKQTGIWSDQGATPTGIQTLKLRTKVPWDKIADFVRGVVMPLRNDGADLEVEVLVQASSESRGIKESTLEQKVRETLNQIGATILDESKD